MRLAAPLLTVLALLLGGCEGKPRSSCPVGEVCLRAGNLADPGSLDPARAFVKQDQTVINDLLVGLTTFTPDGRITPGIAQSWTTSADGLTWTFRLRPALWSDGRPVTAEDFVFSLRRLVEPATGASYAVLVFPIRNAEAINRGELPPESLGVSALDDRTVEIRLENPTPYLPAVLAHYGVVPVPPHAVRRFGDRWSEPGRFVSNGPFQLVSWRLGDRIVLKKNPRFYDAENVCLDRIEYFPTADSIAAERRVKRGELDLNSAFAWNRTRYLQGPGGMAEYVRVQPWTDVHYVVFRMSDPVFRDARVRQALAMSIDREFLARLLAGGQQPTHAFVPPGLGGLPAAPDWAALPLGERQARARMLLAQAGYGPDRPLRFEMKAPAGGRGLSIPVALQADWRSVGVQVTLAAADLAVFFSDLQRGDFQVGLTDWIADYPDPTNFLDLMRSDQPASNYAGWADLEYDRLLRLARAERDPLRRARLLQAAEVRLLQAAPIAPLFVNPSHNLVSPRLTGWADNLDDVHPKRWVCFKAHASAATR
jgi:oligopeptide transport system substrate-binding protein